MFEEKKYCVYLLKWYWRNNNVSDIYNFREMLFKWFQMLSNSHPDECFLYKRILKTIGYRILIIPFVWSTGWHQMNITPLISSAWIDSLIFPMKNWEKCHSDVHGEAIIVQQEHLMDYSLDIQRNKSENRFSQKTFIEVLISNILLVNRINCFPSERSRKLLLRSS